MKNIKVILLQNVPMLGQKDELKEVKPGFWRNFLVPRGLAIEATPELIKQAEKRREEAGKQKEQEEKRVHSLTRQILQPFKCPNLEEIALYYQSHHS